MCMYFSEITHISLCFPRNSRNDFWFNANLELWLLQASAIFTLKLIMYCFASSLPVLLQTCPHLFFAKIFWKKTDRNRTFRWRLSITYDAIENLRENSFCAILYRLWNVFRKQRMTEPEDEFHALWTSWIASNKQIIRNEIDKKRVAVFLELFKKGPLLTRTHICCILASHTEEAIKTKIKLLSQK